MRQELFPEDDGSADDILRSESHESLNARRYVGNNKVGADGTDNVRHVFETEPVPLFRYPEFPIGGLQVRHLLLELSEEGFVVLPEKLHLFAERFCWFTGLAVFRQDLLYDGDQRVRLLGFEDEPIRSQARRKCLILGISIRGGVKDKGYVFQGIIRFPFPAEGVAVHHRHQDIGDDQIRGGEAGLLQGVSAVFGLDHIKTIPLQQGLQQVQVGGVVVDDQDAACHGHVPFMCAGRCPSTCVIKVFGSIGFSIYPLHPVSIVFSRSPGIA